MEECRLCLGTVGRMLPIFAEEDESRKLRLRILHCCLVELVDEESLPKSICLGCESKVNTAYEFREQCRNSERRLRERWDELNSKEVRKEKEERGERWVLRRTGSNFRDCFAQTEPCYCICTGQTNQTQTGEIINAAETIVNEDNEKRFRSAIENIKSNENEKFQVETDENVESPAGKRGKLPEVFPGNWCTDVSEEDRTSTLPIRYLCDVCSKTFASKSGLRFHLKSHNGTKPHVCRYCNKGFEIPSYRKRHEKIHTGDKRFVCHVCSATFASTNGFKYHLRSHTGEANYRCDVCGKCFARYKYLKEHIFTHTGERPFVCKICGSAYGNSGSLFTHEKKCNLRNIRKSIS